MDSSRPDPWMPQVDPHGSTTASSIKPLPPRGFAGIAWIAILVLVGIIVWDANRPQQEPVNPAAATQPGHTIKAAQVDPTGEMIGRLLVGVKNGVSAETASNLKPRLLQHADVLKKGSPRSQMGYAVLVAEIDGAKAGLDDLESLKPAWEREAEKPEFNWDSTARQVLEDLEVTFQANQQGVRAGLSPEAQQRLETELGWFGKLAPLTEGTADQAGRDTMMSSLRNVPWALGGVVFWYAIWGLAGAVILVLLLVLAVMGKLKHGLESASPSSGVYAESFALWLGAFVGMRYGIVGNMPVSWSHLALAMNIVGLLLVTGVALGWCVLRGIPWQVVRVDLGLTFGPTPMREIGAGFMMYAAALPLLLVGGLLTFVLTALQERLAPGSPPPSHPAQQMLMGANWATIIQIMVLGVIVAPLVEETMFRGALYRHLRDCSRWLGFVGSAVGSAAISSVIFAAIHPQGWVFIPALASLAVAFCIAREWRGSLPAGMIAHGITNFITLGLNVLLFA